MTSNGSSVSSLHWCGLITLALAQACAVPQEETLTSNQPIINGTVPPKGGLEGYGVVDLGGCTGTMLTNRHVLTAHHCTGRYNPDKNDWSGTLNPPGSMNIRLERSSVDSTASNQSILEPSVTWLLDANDYSLITLDKPLVNNDASDLFYNKIYSSSDSSLVSKDVLCMGYGGTVEATNTTFASGFGTLTSATMKIAYAGSGVLRRDRANNIVGFGGDSGSTCYSDGLVTGVQSTCSATWVDVNVNKITDGWLEKTNTSHCNSSAPSNFRTWAEDAILADVDVSYDALPALPANAVATGHLTPTTGASYYLNALQGTHLTKVAPRSGRIEVAIDVEPAGMMCPKVTTWSPMEGTASARGRCLGDGLVAAML